LERLRNDFHQGLELLARAEDENESLNKEKASLQLKLRNTKDELEEQRSHYKGKRQELEGHSKELAQLRSTTKVLRFELDAARGSFGNKDDDLRELKDGYGQLLAQLGVDVLQRSLDETDPFDAEKTLGLVMKAARTLVATRDKQAEGEKKLRDQLAVQNQELRGTAGQLEMLKQEKRGLEQDVRALSLSAVDSNSESWAAQEQLKHEVQELHHELERVQSQQNQQHQSSEREHHLLAQLRAIRGEHQQSEIIIAEQQEQLIKAREVFNSLSQRVQLHGKQNTQWGAEKHQLVKTRSRLIGASLLFISLVISPQLP
jgi:chromosome segregation ATPase